MLLGLCGYKETFFTPKVDQIIFLRDKNYVFWKKEPRLPYLMSLMQKNS